jgi:hypothetical protein
VCRWVAVSRVRSPTPPPPGARPTTEEPCASPPGPACLLFKKSPTSPRPAREKLRLPASRRAPRSRETSRLPPRVRPSRGKRHAPATLMRVLLEENPTPRRPARAPCVPAGWPDSRARNNVRPRSLTKSQARKVYSPGARQASPLLPGTRATSFSHPRPGTLCPHRRATKTRGAFAVRRPAFAVVVADGGRPEALR